MPTAVAGSCNHHAPLTPDELVAPKLASRLRNLSGEIAKLARWFIPRTDVGHQTGKQFTKIQLSIGRQQDHDTKKADYDQADQRLQYRVKQLCRTSTFAHSTSRLSPPRQIEPSSQSPWLRRPPQVLPWTLLQTDSYRARRS